MSLLRNAKIYPSVGTASARTAMAVWPLLYQYPDDHFLISVQTFR